MAEPVIEATVVPDKFKNTDGTVNVDSLVKSYVELEKLKAGAGQTNTPPAPSASETPPPNPPPTPTGDSPPPAAQPPSEGFTKFEKEFVKEGKLSDASYADLEKAGFPKDVVNDFIQFRQQQVETYAKAVTDEVGGTENYASLLQWAEKNLKPEEAVAFDAAVQSNDLNKAKSAVQGLKTRYEVAFGRDPALLGGGLSSGGSRAFASMDEAVKFRSNPKFETDPDYAREYRDRLRVSQI